MNPLQEKASQLRAALQQQATATKEHQQAHKHIVGEQLAKQFSTDFPQLYQLLIQSGIHIAGEPTHQGQQVILSSADKHLTVYYQGLKNDYSVWRFHGKDYQAGSMEHEQQFIIALADAFLLAQSKKVPGR